MDHGKISRYTIKKAVSTKFGKFKYTANFVTDNQTFTKCELNISEGWQGDYKYTKVLKCREGDTFDTAWGQQKSLEICFQRFIAYKEKSYKKELESFNSQVNAISVRFEETIADVHKTKEEREKQLLLFEEEKK